MIHFSERGQNPNAFTTLSGTRTCNNAARSGRTTLLVLLLSVSTWTGGLLDGQALANEGTCDALIGATPGLYGLCVAFNEVTDTPVDLSTDPNAWELPVPSAKILENYHKKMLAGDLTMPGVNFQPPPCPAWTAEELALVGLYGETSFRVDDLVVDHPEVISYFDSEEGISLGFFRQTRASVSHVKSSNVYFGDFVHINVDESINIFRRTSMTEAEFSTCKQQVLDHSMAIATSSATDSIGAVPEPATSMLLMLGGMGAGLVLPRALIAGRSAPA